MKEWKPEIQWRAPDSLTPYARNSKKHPTEQVDKIAAQIAAVGFTQPIVIDKDGIIIVGHGRREASMRLGLKSVPVIIADHLNEHEVMAMRIADNKVAESEWDQDMLKFDLGTLNLNGFDLKLTGFDVPELQSLLSDLPQDTDGAGGNTDENETPEEPEIVRVKKGELFTLGAHRLLCGDSTDENDIKRLMGELKADLIFTDPPYGMSYGGGRAQGDDALNKDGGVLIKSHGMIIGDDLKGDALITMIKDALDNAVMARKSDAAIYVCFTYRTYVEFHKALADIGLKPKACIVWDKGSIGLGYSNYRPQHEFIFYCEGQWHGNNAQSDVWTLSRGNTGEYVHPTQKPVELIEKAITNSTQQGALVLDVFGGSGSTLIAAHKTGRIAYLCDLDPKYVGVILERWARFTGLDPVREDGKKWSEIKAEPVQPEF